MHDKNAQWEEALDNLCFDNLFFTRFSTGSVGHHTGVKMDSVLIAGGVPYYLIIINSCCDDGVS